MNLIYLFIAFCLLGHTLTYENHLSLRHYPEHHSKQSHAALAQWSGDECSEKCKSAGGEPCGLFLKDCCSDECEGTLIKSCKEDKLITLKEMDCDPKNDQLAGIISNLSDKIGGGIEEHVDKDGEKNSDGGDEMNQDQNQRNCEQAEDEEQCKQRPKDQQEKGSSMGDKISDFLSGKLINALVGGD